MDRIHILFLADALYGTCGGAEGILWKMIHLLPANRYRCSIATFAEHPNRVVFPCPVHLFPIRRTYDWHALQTAFRLSRLIRSERVSLVHTLFPTADLFGGVIARLSGCPILVSSRRDMGFQRTRLHRLAYRVAAGMFDQVQTVGDMVRRYHIEQDGLRPERVVTVHNGVDLEAIDGVPMRSPLRGFGLEHASNVVVCVANIRRIKALEVLVETAAMVCPQCPGTRFLVVGAVQDTEYMLQLTKLAQRLGVSRDVIFAGSSSEVVSLLKTSDLFFLPSWSEGLSNALLEAMACGLPCVATDVGGNGELIKDKRSGYLVPAGDSVAAAKRIVRLLQDRSRAKEMGQTGRRLVEERFTVQRMIGKLTELYEGLVSGHIVVREALRTNSVAAAVPRTVR